MRSRDHLDNETKQTNVALVHSRIYFWRDQNIRSTSHAPLIEYEYFFPLHCIHKFSQKSNMTLYVMYDVYIRILFTLNSYRFFYFYLTFFYAA